MAEQTTGQEPIWETIKKLGGDVRWAGASHGAIDLKVVAEQIEAAADQVRALLALEWQRGHGAGVAEERERIQRVLSGRATLLRDRQRNWAIRKADFEQKARGMAEEEAKAKAQADIVEDALASLSEGEGR